MTWANLFSKWGLVPRLRTLGLKTLRSGNRPPDAAPRSNLKELAGLGGLVVTVLGLVSENRAEPPMLPARLGRSQENQTMPAGYTISTKALRDLAPAVLGGR